MTEREIAAFLAVYKHRSVSKAAQALYLSQPTLSAQLHSLENALGVSLFVRGKGQRRLTPTRAGEDLYPLALRFRELTREMLSVGKRRERLCVSCVNSVGNALLSPICAKFMQSMPEVDLSIRDMVTAEAYLNLEQGAIDLALTPGAHASRSVIAAPLFTEEIIFLCAPGSDYPATVGFEDLTAREEIFLNWNSGFFSWHCAHFGSESEVGIRLSLTNQVGDFLQRPGMWCLMPATAVHSFDGVAFETRKTAFQVPPRITYCLRRKNTLEDPVVNCFLACVRQVLREHGEECVLCEE